MLIGVVFPQTEFGNDPGALRAYAQTVEGLGYSHILAYDHVLGADPERPGGWHGPYTYETPFHEPFCLFSFFSAVTERIGFVTGVLILPQRETALAAKQAAALDVLSGGRLRLGVGVGWNAVEYEALGQDFRRRGRRMDAQVALLRRLWTEPLVTVADDFHTISAAGINPLPVQRPIPIWFGGHADAVLRRLASSGDGWLPNYRSPADLRPELDKLDGYLQAAGRRRADIGLEPRLSLAGTPREQWESVIAGWAAAGATHLTINTMGCGYASPADHLAALATFAAAAGLAA